MVRIGILTYHRSHNYGAFLQAYSLTQALNELEGITCEIINYNLNIEDRAYLRGRWKRPLYIPTYIKQDKMFDKVQSEQKLSGELVLDDSFENILSYAEKHYDAVIVGSDEIWRIASRGFPNVYWLPGKRQFIKISYAASGRNPASKLTDDVCKKMYDLYKDFAYIGVRDEITGMQVKSILPELMVHRNCDPAFLYKKFKKKDEARKIICNKWGLQTEKKLIAVMYDRFELVSKLKKYLGKEYQFVCITRPMWNASKNLCLATPFEWVDIIGGCDFMISSYFHGMVFAINQNTPFLAIDRRATRGNIDTSKMYDLLSYMELEERYYLASEMTADSWKEIAKRIEQEANLTVDFSHKVSEQRKLFDDFKRDLLRIINE